MLLSTFLRYQIDSPSHVLSRSVEREYRRSDSVVQISRYIRRTPSSATEASTVYASVPRDCQLSISSSYSCHSTISSSYSWQSSIVLPRHCQPSVLRVPHASSSEPWILATLIGGFSCLLQKRLNSGIPLVCQRNALCMCAQSDSTCPLAACTAHSIACSTCACTQDSIRD